MKENLEKNQPAPRIELVKMRNYEFNESSNTSEIAFNSTRSASSEVFFFIRI